MREQLSHAPLAVVTGVLQHDSDLRAPAVVTPSRINTKHTYVAIRSGAIALENLDRGSLTFTIGAQHCYPLVGVYLQIEALKHLFIPVNHPQPGNGDHWRTHTHSTLVATHR